LKDKKSQRVRVPFRLEGSYANPKISVDLRSSDMLKENIGDALKGLFNK
jgi:hypothetical protein